MSQIRYNFIGIRVILIHIWLWIKLSPNYSLYFLCALKLCVIDITKIRLDIFPILNRVNDFLDHLLFREFPEHLVLQKFRCNYHLSADDFQIFLPSFSAHISVYFDMIKDIQNISNWVIRNYLLLNPNKTQLCSSFKNFTY